MKAQGKTMWTENEKKIQEGKDRESKGGGKGEIERMGGQEVGEEWQDMREATTGNSATWKNCQPLSLWNKLSLLKQHQLASYKTGKAVVPLALFYKIHWKLSVWFLLICFCSACFTFYLKLNKTEPAADPVTSDPSLLSTCSGDQTEPDGPSIFYAQAGVREDPWTRNGRGLVFSLFFSPSPHKRLQQVAASLEPGSARGVSLLKGSSSSPPSVCLQGIILLLGFSLWYCMLCTF